MGALAPCSPWIPKDDLLLKNAIEAGASLESLAKGAVVFSRRFTMKELQDRWHSLLYDEPVSSNVAEKILLLDPSAHSFTKNSKCFTSRGKEGNSRKRKMNSVRTRYYSLRKRICNEPDIFCDQSYLVGTSLPNDVHQNENVCFEQNIGAGLSCENIYLNPPSGNHLVIPESGFHGAEHGLDRGDLTPNGGELPKEIIDERSLYGFTEYIPSSLILEGVGRDPPPAFDSGNLRVDSLQILEDNLNAQNESDILSFIHTESAREAFLGGDSLHQKPILCFDAKDNNFDSPVSDPMPSLNQLELSCPQSLAVWPLEDFTVCVDPVDSNFEANKTSALPDDDGKELACSDFDVQSDPKDNDSKLVLSEKDFMELSLLHFSSDDEPFLDANYMIDHSSLENFNYILSDTQLAYDAKEPINTAVVALADGMPREKLDVVGNCLQVPSGDEQSYSISRFSETHQVSSHQTTSKYKYEECLFCTLNTEDPDVPDNSEIFPSCAVELPCFETTNSDFVLKNEFENWEHCDEDLFVSTPAQNMTGSAADATVVVPFVNLGDCRKKPELMDDSSSVHTLRDSCTEVAASDMVVEGNVEAHGLQKEDVPVHIENYSLGRCQAGKTSQVLITDIPTKDDQLEETLFLALGSEDSSPESDTDVPYFSDVEAMILDMDLDPYDEDSCFPREVSRFQFEDTKKTIIRLEQAANSCMQRAIASHGALAFFYGRKMKYYIKKPEVIIGRGTDDVNVDIDLRIEGRANKISRRQAVIKMEEDGMFYLTNLGKHPISMNNREVSSGQQISLSSSCLIEIKGMRFMFEMNRHFDKRHVLNIASVTKKNDR